MPTLADVAADPSAWARELTLPSGSGVVVRPLEAHDGVGMTAFFDGLSQASRVNGGVSADTAALASGHCDAIGRYDKLRLVATTPGDRIVGLFELSFDVVAADVERFRRYRIDLGGTDARFGLCVADDVQGTGLADVASAATFDVARAFGRTRLILWGGVLDTNVRARRFYRRLGFTELGTWVEPGGAVVHDGALDL